MPVVLKGECPQPQNPLNPRKEGINNFGGRKRFMGHFFALA